MPSEEEKNVFLESLRNEEAKVQQALADTKKDSSGQESGVRKRNLSGTALFATLFLLFLLVLTLLIFVISVGGARNPILQSFGIESGEVKEFLKGLVNWTFGSLAILLLLLFSIGLFRGISAKKEEKEKRRNSLIFGFVSGGLIFAVVLTWLATFAFISKLPASAVGTDARIQVLNLTKEDEENGIVAPIEIYFSAEEIETSLQAQGKQIRKFRWDKNGDGDYEIDGKLDPRINLIFRTAGRQKVGLLVELADGQTETFSLQFTIDAVVFEAKPTRGEVPLSVEFSAREVTQNLAVKTFEWDFDGDGQYDATTSSAQTTYTFQKIGVFPVHLRVILQDDQVMNFTRDIVVSGSTTDRIKAVISATPQEGEVPLEVTFSAENSFTNEGNIVIYNWTLEENTELRGQSIAYTFTTPGTYRVELRVEDEQGLSDIATTEILAVKPLSTPSIVLTTNPRVDTHNQILSTSAPFTVSFDASKTTDPDDDIDSFSWDFNGDQMPDASGDFLSHTFETAGIFPVTLTVTDEEGNTAQQELIVIIQKDSVVASIIPNPETGPVPLTIDFDGSGSSCGTDCKIISYEWYFGDGTPVQVTGAHTKHTFTEVGTFTVKLRVTTDAGETGESTRIIAVRVPPLTACFTPSRFSGMAPLTVSFKDCSNGTVQNWKWDFGDGVVSNERAPEHTFQNPGEYTVVLQVSDQNSTTSTTSHTLTVQ